MKFFCGYKKIEMKKNLFFNNLYHNKTPNLKLWQNSKTEIMTKIKNVNCKKKLNLKYRKRKENMVTKLKKMSTLTAALRGAYFFHMLILYYFYGESRSFVFIQARLNSAPLIILYKICSGWTTTKAYAPYVRCKMRWLYKRHMLPWELRP